jgi:hypothetical protein
MLSVQPGDIKFDNLVNAGSLQHRLLMANLHIKVRLDCWGEVTEKIRKLIKIIKISQVQELK